MHRTVVLNVVGLTPDLLKAAPNILALARDGAWRPLTTITPALTCSVQASFVTGQLPRDHISYVATITTKITNAVAIKISQTPRKPLNISAPMPDLNARRASG